MKPHHLLLPNERVNKSEEDMAKENNRNLYVIMSARPNSISYPISIFETTRKKPDLLNNLPVEITDARVLRSHMKK